MLGVFPNINDAWDFLGLVVLSNRGIAVPWFEGGSGRGLLLILLVGGLRVVGGRPVAAIGVEPHGRAGTIGPVGRARASSWSWSSVGSRSATRGACPASTGARRSGGMRVDPSFFALFFALVIYTASHIAEIVRGSIQAVPAGQAEAADARRAQRVPEDVVRRAAAGVAHRASRRSATSTST